MVAAHERTKGMSDSPMKDVIEALYKPIESIVKTLAGASSRGNRLELPRFGSSLAIEKTSSPV
jgi:hypothetical protein